MYSQLTQLALQNNIFSAKYFGCVVFHQNLIELTKSYVLNENCLLNTIVVANNG